MQFSDAPPLTECLNLDAQLEYSKLVQLGSKQRVSMMVSLHETMLENLKEFDGTVDVICCIDVSGSMEGQKLQNVKRSLKYVIDLLKVSSRLAIVAFSSKVTSVMNFKKTSNQDAKVGKIISALAAGGDTNITAGMKAVQNLIKNRKDRMNPLSVFVLTDGKHNVGTLDLDSLFANDDNLTPYVVNTFGYGDDHDAAVLQSLSEAKGGNYYFVSDVDRIDECFLDCLGITTTAVAHSGKITVNLKQSEIFPQVRVDRVYGPYMKRLSDKKVEISIPSIYVGMKKDFIMDIDFEPSSNPVSSTGSTHPLANIELSYNASGNKPGRSSFAKDFYISVVPKEMASTVMKNNNVKANVIRVRGALAIKAANQKRKDGNPQEAVTMLKFFLEEINKAVSLADNPIVCAMKAEISNIITFIQNDMLGRKNAVKSDNYIMQQMNVYGNQCTAPIFEKRGLFSNKQQTSNMKALYNFRNQVYSDY